MSISNSFNLFGSAGSFIEYESIIDKLEKGDLIEIQRNNYQHWVIIEKLVNDNALCFHVVKTSNLGNNAQIVKKCGFNSIGELRYEPLLNVLQDNDSKQLSLCRVNNQKMIAQEMLKKSKNEMPNIEEIFIKLHTLKGKLILYDVKNLNCEHYCTLLKYGIGWSSQVNQFKEIINTGLEAMDCDEIIKNHHNYENYASILVSGLCLFAKDVVEKMNTCINGLTIDKLIIDTKLNEECTCQITMADLVKKE